VLLPPFYPSTRQHHWKHWALTADKHRWEKAGRFLSGPEARSPYSDCLGTRKFSLSAHIICVHPCPSVVSTAWIRLGDPRSSCRNFDGPMQRRFLHVMPPGDPGPTVSGQIPFKPHYLPRLVQQLELGSGNHGLRRGRRRKRRCVTLWRIVKYDWKTNVIGFPKSMQRFCPNIQ